jgi:hypothetical protein
MMVAGFCKFTENCTFKMRGWVQWLMPIIPATWEAEIRRIPVQGQNKQKEARHGGMHL